MITVTNISRLMAEMVLIPVVLVVEVALLFTTERHNGGMAPWLSLVVHLEESMVEQELYFLR